MAKLQVSDIKKALELTQNLATKKLLLASAENFPKMLSEYKWTSAKPYDMALTIIAFYAYCRQSKDDKIKQFGKTSKQKGHDSFKLLNNLKKGDGQRIKSLIQKCLEKPLNEILEMVIPGEENMLERSKIIANFVKQTKKITPSGFDSDQNEMIEVLVNTITESKEELKKELEKVKSDFTPGKKEAAKNTANIDLLKRQMLVAIDSNNPETVRQLIESNPVLVDLPYNPYANNIPLQWAARRGYREIVNLSLDLGADPNIRDNYGDTPLHMAARGEHEEIVNLLLDHGADPNIKNRLLDTPLHDAVREENREIVELLLNHGADPNIQDRRERTLLNSVILRGHEEMVNLLLDHGADPNIQDRRFGDTPLHIAASDGHERIVNLLLDHGADPNIQGRRFGDTPLHRAARSGHQGIVNLLLAHGAAPNIRDNRGRTYQDLLPRPQRLQRNLRIADFPQDEFRRSLAQGEQKQCPICLDEFGANDLCCIFDCVPPETPPDDRPEDYPYGHPLCNECAQAMLDDPRTIPICPLCRKGLKPHN
ncbi:MAG: ankyrin repeat domain-containing protein [Clostridia bacterium]|nr:ankyrin repeat domain-containing protein [Clostridia bacterium]